MSADIKMLKPEEHSSVSTIRTLKDALAKAESGEIVGIILIAEERGSGYFYTRNNITYEAALGLCNRAQWILNQDWDKYK
jgi:hypothetical protein